MQKRTLPSWNFPPERLLSAMEICLDYLRYQRIVFLRLRRQFTVIVRLQASYYAVDHFRTEDIVLLVISALLKQAIRRFRAICRKMLESIRLCCILSLVYIDIDIAPLSYFECIVEFETGPYRYAEACKQLVNIGRSIRRT